MKRWFDRVVTVIVVVYLAASATLAAGWIAHILWWIAVEGWNSWPFAPFGT